VYLIRKFQRYIQYMVVGVIGALINWSILYVLTEYGHLWYILSAAIGIIVSNTINYLGSQYWVFKTEKERNKNLITGWVKFQTSAGIMTLVSLGIIALLTEVFGLWYMFSAISAGFICATLMFITVRKWIWGKREEPIPR
jgi:dolichol-phosphate mannosyltransferase